MNNARVNKARGMALLKARGAARAVVSYSGGNDSGGADEIVLQDDHGNTLWSTENEYSSCAADKELVETLTEPMYAMYGGFAGEYDCHGEIVWDVAGNTVTLAGQESRVEWDDVGSEW